MIFKIRTILLLLALLSGIYAHPLGVGGVHGIKFSTEKRCELNYCPLAPPLPYPSGFSARTCRKLDGNNPFAIGLTPAPRKRSIIPTTTTHTENAGRLSLRQSRSNVCDIVAHMARFTNENSPRVNTPEFLMFAQSNYVLAFTFDVIVENVIAWGFESNRYVQLQSLRPMALHGTMVLGGLRIVARVHFQFFFRDNSDHERALGYEGWPISVDGTISVFRLSTPP